VKRIAVVLHSYFPQDARIRKETVAIAAAGYDVQVLCLRAAGESAEGVHGSIRIRRLPVARDRSRGKLGYLLEYAGFWLRAAAALRGIQRATPIDLVIVHNVPEQLVYAAYPLKRKGVPILLDIHDPLPELFADKYGLLEGSRVKAVLTRMELGCCEFADHVLVPTMPVKTLLMRLGVPEHKITVVMNSPDGILAVREASQQRPFVLVYHGSVFERYGLDVVLRGMAVAADRAPDVELLVFGSDTDPAHVAALKSLAVQLGIADRVAFSQYTAQLALARVLGAADAGVSSLRRSEIVDLMYPTKMFEYLACGLPVLAASTPAIVEVFGDAPVDFYEPENPSSFADALVALIERTPRAALPERRNLLKSEVSWGEMASRCVEVVDNLVGNLERSREPSESASRGRVAGTDTKTVSSL
jgi:glycosyltransferase involved in cell wall biosynthesis